MYPSRHQWYSPDPDCLLILHLSDEVIDTFERFDSFIKARTTVATRCTARNRRRSYSGRTVAFDLWNTRTIHVLCDGRVHKHSTKANYWIGFWLRSRIIVIYPKSVGVSLLFTFQSILNNHALFFLLWYTDCCRQQSILPSYTTLFHAGGWTVFGQHFY